MTNRILAAMILMGTVAFAQERQKPQTTSSDTERDSFRLAGRLVWVTSMADLIGTEVALTRDCHEMNPLGRKRFARIPVKVGLTYLSNYLTAKLADKGHKKSATILRWCLVAAFVFATGNNIAVSF